jgi:polysaccharide pyruvyl transferase WcaK-like protein
VADPGFLLPGVPVEDPELLARVRNPNTVGLFPSLGFIEDGADLSQIPRIAAALDELHEQEGLNFLSVPMRVLPDEIDDLHVTQLIREKMRQPDALESCEHRFGAGQLKWLAGQFSLNITVRLHALIFSLAGRVPTVAIEYEPKVTNLLRDFRLEDFGVPMGEKLTHSLVERTLRARNDRNAVSAHIGERLPVFEASARRCFEAFEELLGATNPTAPAARVETPTPLESPGSPAERGSSRSASS